MPKPLTIFTVGHSTRSLEDFIGTLKAHGIKALADVRKYPGSRRLPWFNAENLAIKLPEAGIAYLSFADLGGRRRAVAGSPNSGWRNESFRGYADYMQTPEFQAALDRLIQQARQTPTSIMCAEAVPWRCHRSLIADALLVRGWCVLDLFDVKKASSHQLTPFAKVDGLRITYPSASGHDESPTLFES
jgi:uncharacterized protein (DUF488 family)